MRDFAEPPSLSLRDKDTSMKDKTVKVADIDFPVLSTLSSRSGGISPAELEHP
ncbi:hypothetical protein [Methylobacter sp. YRD-M1]|uniref:hypothetical protein n=1 Tax=Methylobacter sp. YRD-M1 TaxID=2911520 RepID=UPI00227A3740|nr:hypothetical protein [Methylobacter sp. YRD-M1]WAK02338.1 hypothetical protein LZ558_00725 [Methylobacter sp. YRD-M1]